MATAETIIIYDSDWKKLKKIVELNSIISDQPTRVSLESVIIDKYCIWFLKIE